MANNKSQLVVAAIENGTVIDHIPAEKTYQVVNLLQLEKMETPVTIGYNLPQAWISKFGIAQLRIFASGQNLWEATGLYKYLDPDATGNRKKDGEMEDRMTKYPFCRTYSFGINVTF